MIKEGRVALVTGAGGGIGREISLEFARNGAKVAILDMAEDLLKETADLIADLGGEALAVNCNITDKDECFKAVDRTIEKWGTVDILVNCAGIMKDRTIKNIRDEDWDMVMDVNLKGPLYLTQAVYGLMKEQKYGRIISIASPAYLGNAGQGSYASSKAGLISFTKVTAAELARHGVTANVVCPGLLKTKITEKMSDEIFDKYEKMIPMGRLCQVEDVAYTVMVFASEKASYLTGQILTSAGGSIMDK